MTQRILFLAANPAGTPALKLDEEARAIQDELRMANQRDQFEFVTRLAARPMDLLRALRDAKPTIVHFAGHAGTEGIYLTGEDGLPVQVTRETLLATFGAAGQSVQIVVLNGCSTERIAQALCEHVPVCAGTPAAILDDAARMFSVGFYGALASGESVARACLHGRAAIRLAAPGGHDQSHLHHRRDVDPDVLVTGSDRPVMSVMGVFRPPEGPAAFQRSAPVAEYRARKIGSFERWDLRAVGPTPTVGHRPGEITLDEMYIPLRFAAELDLARADRGAPITPDDLVRPRQPQVVIGGAGSGKTTWMRWTFRRLIRDRRAMPFFLELRVIATTWKTPQDAGRSIDSYLADELTACGVSDAPAVVALLLADSVGLQPVILIDGWDELGALGERLRERLVEFCRAFPRVVVVVSSRPYGDTRPAGAESFDTLHIQPLVDSDVRLMTMQFQRRVHGLDESAGARATDEFMAALAVAPDARSLAGTMLLLTMMLLLSREGPLPDRRHRLYNACLRNMVLNRVIQRERDGGVVDLDQWRPDDSEERLRAVAELAYRMQSESYEKSQRALIVRAWDDAVSLLGGEGTHDQRDRFLRWLVATAGVLIDRSDGSIQFAHLSFQEHLAAYYLFIAREGQERVTAVRSHMADRRWWETLRLWAGLIGDKWPENLGPVFDALRANADAYWLAGQIFADGTGRASDFNTWVAELPVRLSDPFTSAEDCALAWGACRQEDRRGSIAKTLASVRGSLRWLDGTWHAHWCELANLDVEPAPALLALEAPIDRGDAVARSRVLLGGAASWPDGGELAVLRLWPGMRPALGVRLQTAISIGARPAEVGGMLSPLLARSARVLSSEVRSLAEELSQVLIRYFSQYFGREFGENFGRYFGRYLGWCFVQEFGTGFVRDYGRYLGRDYGRDLGRDFGRDFLWHFTRGIGRNFVRNFGRYFVRDFGRDLARNFGRDFVGYFGRDLRGPEPHAGLPWLPAFAFVEGGSTPGRVTPRIVLAHGEVHDETPLLALFRAACKASLAPDDARLLAETARACDAFRGDPLWPALARHVARLSTPEDRALLEDLARHPEQRAPPLSWGLQYYVRGDLVFDDDSVVTLDELCARAGLAPLPLLEAMPDELEIPVDDAAP